MYITLGLLGFLAHAVGSQEVLIGDAANALGIEFIALIAILWIVILTAIGIEAIWAKLNSDPRNFAERWMEGRVLLLTIALGVLGVVAVAFHVVVRLELPVSAGSTSTPRWIPYLTGRPASNRVRRKWNR